MRRALGILLATALLLAAPLAGAQDLSKPILLVATPDLQGPYSHTAVLAVPVGDKHIGFILNRATDATLGKMFPDHPPSLKVVDPIFFGGPEAADAIFALLRRDPGGPSIRLLGDLYLTGNSGSIDRIIEQTPNDARYFAGFVGWLPEELSAELAKGYWYAADADPDLVFQKDTREMWEQLVKRMGKSLAPRRPGDQEAMGATSLAALRE